MYKRISFMLAAALMVNLFGMAAPARAQRYVPNVVGMDEVWAALELGAFGFLVGDISREYSDTVSEGHVISQNPTGGSIAWVVFWVDLVISRGPLARVPDVVGKTEAAARSAITSAGLVVGGISHGYSSTVPEGRVRSSDPAAGARVFPGSAVDLTISLGQRPPEITSLSGFGDAVEVGVPVEFRVIGKYFNSGTTASISGPGASISDVSVVFPAGIYGIIGDVVFSCAASNSSQTLTVTNPDGQSDSESFTVGTLQVKVPGVVGEAQANAESEITDAGLVVGTITYECSDTVAEGNVISQQPAAEASVACGSIVNLTVSLGPWTVPDVVGMSESDAASAINSAELSVGSMGYLYSDTVPEGRVISSYPRAGTVVDPGSEVDLDISMGPDTGGPTVEVPDVVGMTESDAKSVITSESLTVGTISNDYSDSVPKGFVISQYPAGGTSVAEGYSVLLTISLGPEPGDVPSVGGLVGHWKLDEGSGTTVFDASSNGHDGTIQGTPTWIDSQRGYGKALYFAGANPADGYVDCGTWNPSEGTEQLTVALWVQWDGPVEGVWQGVIGKRDGWAVDNMMWQIEINKDNQQISFARTDVHPWCGGIVLTEGEWQHVAVTFDGTTAVFYVNGEETGRGDFSFGAKTDATIAFGCVGGSGWNGFNGALDEIRLYNCGLSESEIRAVMAGAETIVLSESKDIGTTGGSDIYEDGVYTIVANGTDIWDNRDEFRYVYAPVSGDFEVSARVLNLENTNWWAKAGVMVRETLEGGARHAFMCVTPQDGEGRFAFQCRSMGTGEMTTSFHTVPGQVFYPINTWVKIRRQGSTFTSFISEDGIVWEEFPGTYLLTRSHEGSNPVTIDMPETVYVGLAVTSHLVGTLCMAEFDDVVIRTTGGTDPLSEALDTALSFTTGGSADWFGQTTTFYNDGDAAQSGDISDDQESWMQTTVSGKGIVSFYWKVSSERYCDFLDFYIDGLLQDGINGSVDWQQKTYTISTSGSHTLEWRYMKDGITDYGSDCGWVDKVEWVTTP